MAKIDDENFFDDIEILPDEVVTLEQHSFYTNLVRCVTARNNLSVEMLMTEIESFNLQKNKIYMLHLQQSAEIEAYKIREKALQGEINLLRSTLNKIISDCYTTGGAPFQGNEGSLNGMTSSGL